MKNSKCENFLLNTQESGIIYNFVILPIIFTILIIITINSTINYNEVINKNTNLFIIKLNKFYFRVFNKLSIYSRVGVNIFSSIDKSKLIEEDEDDNKKYNKFTVYTSISDIGCFRLAWELLPGRGPHKGFNDYIQETFINIKLQKFIYKVFRMLPEDPNNIHYAIQTEIYTTIFERSNAESRIISKIPFNKYNERIKCGSEQDTDQADIITNLNEFSENIESLYNVDIASKEFIFKHTLYFLLFLLICFLGFHFLC